MRPTIHFSAERQWINDPNGLVFLDGEYHLFFQTNPHGANWGHMSWGHAVSPDLIEWTRLPAALTPYPARTERATTMIFSGSALVDRVGLSGAAIGSGLLAYYTAHERADDQPINESVALATSADGGRTWARHTANPIIDLGRQDFRDPKVFWHQSSNSMVMAVADPVGRCVEFFRSSDGLSWRPTGSFATPGVTSMIWECPDLVEVPIEGSTSTRWVMLVSNGHRAGEPFTGMQYWVGQFNGETFEADDSEARVVDFGKDFYAAITYNDLPDGSPPTMIGWASNWVYASSTPTSPWRGLMALPRELALRPTSHGPVLVQRPIRHLDGMLAESSQTAPIAGAVDIRWTTDASRTSVAGIRLKGSKGSVLDLELSRAVNQLTCDRTRAGDVDFSDAFPSVDHADVPHDWDGRPIETRVIFDGCIVEVFTCDGEVTLTSLAFTEGPWTVEPLGRPSCLEIRRIDVSGTG